jgi:hypothetical protein
MSERWGFTISELLIGFPQIIHTAHYDIITIQLSYNKFCPRRVLKLLLGVHKTQRTALALSLSSTATKMAMNFLIPGNKIMVSFVIIETTEQSKH